MKFLAGVFLVVLAVFVIAIGGAWYFFSNSSSYVEQAQDLLTDALGRQVTISSIESNWRQGNPEIMLRGIEVAGEPGEEPVLSSEHVILELDGKSLFSFWPSLRNVTIHEPTLEVVTLPNGGIRIAGVEIQADPNRPPPFQLFRWILDHWRIDLAGGSLRWIQADGSMQEYRDIALQYRREDRNRQLSGVVRYPEGNLVLNAEITGNPFSDSDWDTSFSLIAAGDESENSQSGLEVTSSNGEGQLFIARLEVGHLRDILIVSGLQPSLGGWLQTSSAGGVLESVDLRFSGPLDSLRDWRLTADIVDMTFAPTEQYPGMTGIGGEIELGSEGGEIALLVDSGRFDWPKNLLNPIVLDQGGGRLTWAYRDGAFDVDLHDGFVRNSDAQVSGFSASALWQPGERPRGEVEMAFEIPRMERALGYLPRKTTDKFRAWWNNAVQGGRASNGSLSYDGILSLETIKNNEGNFRVEADLSNVDLDYGYVRGWPVLRNARAEFMLENDLISIQTSYGEFDNSTVTGGNVRIADLFTRARILAVEEGEVEGPVKDLVNLLLRGPLVRLENQPDIEISSSQGQYQTTLFVSMPLSNIKDVQVQGRGSILDASLRVPPGDELTAINGDVEFTERSVNAAGVTANFIGGEVIFDVRTTRKATPPEVEIAASGTLDADHLDVYLGRALASMLIGKTTWDGTLQLGPGYVSIAGKSDLLGMSVAFPEPVFKGPSLPRALNFEVELSGSNDRLIGFQYGDRLAASLTGTRRDDKILLESGEIVYGSTEPLLASSGGIGISVVESSLDADVWLQTIRHMSDLGEEDSSGFVDALRRVHIAANELTMFEEDFERVEMVANSEDGAAWTALLTGERVNGWAKAGPMADQPWYELNFTHLYWPDSEDEDEVDADDVDPADYPRLNVHVDDFRFGEKNLGALDLLAGPRGDDWEIEKLEFVQPDLEIKVSGQWSSDETGPATEIDFTAISTQGGAALESIGFKDFVEGGGLELEGSLNWPGGPGSFRLGNLNGKYEFSATEGHILQVDPKSGRLFGLMNINALSRRLRLDFSDIFEDGLAFDQIGSQGSLLSGDMLLDSFFIIGPAVYMQAEGRVGLAQEDFDMEVVVSPQLGGNIAVLSALANPAAGALVYLAQKIFSKQLNEAMHDTYVVTGPWDDASIERRHYEPPPPEPPEPEPLIPVAIEAESGSESGDRDSSEASELMFRPILPPDGDMVEPLPRGTAPTENEEYDLQSEPLTNSP